MNKAVKATLVALGISTMACLGGGGTDDNNDVGIVLPPEDRTEFALVVDQISIGTDAIGDTEVTYTLLNTNEITVDFFRVEITPFDRDGEPVKSSFGETTQRFATEGNIEPGDTSIFKEAFSLWTDPIKTVEVKVIDVTLDDGTEITCSEGLHQQCAWEVSFD